MRRIQIEFSEDFIKRAHKAMRIARARDGFNGDLSTFVRQEYARMEAPFMQALGFPILTPFQSFPLDTPVVEPSAPAPKAAPEPATIRVRPGESTPDLLARLKASIAETRAKPCSGPTAAELGIIFNDRGPVLPPRVFIDLCNEVYEKSNGVMPDSFRSFLIEKLEYATRGNDVMLTFASETSPLGQAGFLMRICERFGVYCSDISTPPAPRNGGVTPPHVPF